MAKITIRDEEGVEKIHELVDDVTTIGRGSTNTIQITDQKASRLHFRIEKEGEFFKVVDLGSTNGTRLNEDKITSQLLKAGDVMRVGKTTFTYEGPGKPASAEPAPSSGPNAPTIRESAGVGAAPIDPPTLKLNDNQVDGPKYVLVGLEGSCAGQTVELGVEPVTIGRKAGNTLKIDDEAASSYHAEIKKEPMGYVISDLGSTNGTKVMGRAGGEYEKIVKQLLTTGAKVRIGKTIFEFKNVGAPSDDDELLGTVVLDSDKLENRLSEGIAERPKKPVTIPPAAIAAAAVLVFVVVVYAVVNVVGPTTDGGTEIVEQTHTDVPPPATGNLLKNADFSAGMTDTGHPEGWVATPGDPKVDIAVEPEAEADAQPASGKAAGLVIYKNDKSSPSCLSVVESKEKFPIDPGKVYELAGALRNDGDGLVGLRVTWISGEREVTEHPVVLMKTQRDWKTKSAAVQPPVWASRARMGVFAQGREGKASFDDLSFKEKPGAPASAAPNVQQHGVDVRFEGSKGQFSAVSGGEPVLADGMLELVSPDKKAVSSLVSAYDPALASDGERRSFRGQLFDFALQQTTTYAVGAAPGAAGVEMNFAVNPQEGAASRPRLRFDIVEKPARGKVQVLAAAGEQELGPTDKGKLEGVKEILFNAGATPQLYLRFAEPVALQTERKGARREVEIEFPSELKFEVASQNVGDKQKMDKLIAQLKDELAKSKWSAVAKDAMMLRNLYGKQFPEATTEARAAETRLSDAMQPVKEELKRKVDGMKTFATDEYAQTVRDWVNATGPTWVGTPLESEFKTALEAVDAMAKAGSAARGEAEAEKLLAKAQEFHKKGGAMFQVAVSQYQQVIDQYPQSKAAATAREELPKAKEQKQRYDTLLAVQERLMDKVKNYVDQGEYEDAINKIKSDPEFLKYGAELEELNKQLRRWEELKNNQ
ncbi:MAG: FHA domain-containing protein [Planctomycetes bacterium]|nr:FHA domain-containing protein [Planctomycetota bacterium]